ncbi:zinc-binding alcohol dehydrogenase family protein [Mycolicibacterium sp. BiH015]|uniref:quinone oxidoreductase family protein n=1 Tax=Mycolicibacterium sp. BiH015 TaxID=3018808 RepID=UPI0022DFD531|nr:zinc-binding alcohol dehydrogenase family protein [Mycolicibacterium sp. BiH015]MDA2894816.1 zinc-binding alcohol dehydrogenase family protein [Mycolicibacterium sp. BiH015]
MKAAVVAEFGQTPRYTDRAEPRAHDNMVVARVAAASIKNLDRGLVAGTHYGSRALHPPFTPGVDGIVYLDDGRLAYSSARVPYGMMAERTIVDPNQAVLLPDGIDATFAAAIPNPGLSAWFSLEYAAGITAGQSILILGATGVTGSVATQLAKKKFGARRVVVAGRNAERLQNLRDLGADEVVQIDDDLPERISSLHDAAPFDAVLDYLWGVPAEQTLAALGNTGMSAGFHRTRYVQIGSMARATITLPSEILRSAGVEIVGVGLGSVPAEAHARANSEILPTLFAMGADGTLTIDVTARPLAEVETAWDDPEPAGTRVVLVP